MAGPPLNDRLKGGFEKAVRAIFGPRIAYLGQYSAVVKAQGSDGSLDLLPDDAAIPGLQGVPIAYGIPGVTVTVAVGARVALTFLGGGDPSKPRATVWDSGSVTAMTVTATAIKLGSSSASQAFVLGTQYATHMGTLQTQLGIASAAATPMLMPPAAAALKAALLAAQAAAVQLAADISTLIKGQ